MSMQLREPSINGRVGPNTCMCGMRYINGHWFKDVGGELYMMANHHLYKVKRM